MKKLQVRLRLGPDDSRVVGTLAHDRGRVFFEYARSFLATGLNLSPLRLPFDSALFEHRDRSFGPLPGLFDDSLPDGWGLLLMDRHFRSLGLDPAGLSPLDRLAWLGRRTMGVLCYHPPTSREDAHPTLIDLHELGKHAQEVFCGAATTLLPQLLRAGGSPGGARPKVLVGYQESSDTLVTGEDELPEGFDGWLVKLFAKTDLEDNGALEFAYSLMAAAAGVDMPSTRLFHTSEGARYFGVRRFDRAPQGRRLHVHTFGNLIQSDFRIPSADYADLLKLTAVLTRNHQELLRAYRRAVFNLLACNRDDHVKNFAFMLDDRTREWRVSPAYDLLFTPGPGGEHSTTFVGEGLRPGRSHLDELAKRAGIQRHEAASIIEEVATATRRWPAWAEQAGVSEAEAQRVAEGLGLVCCTT